MIAPLGYRPLQIAFSAFGITLGGALGGCSHLNTNTKVVANSPVTATQTSHWRFQEIRGRLPGETLIIGLRGAIFSPTRYRLIVVPGSGCTNWQPLADDYFYPLLHAEIVLLTKPGVGPMVTGDVECSPEFVSLDALSSWRDSAKYAIAHHQRSLSRAGIDNLPQILIGVSEGAELLPDLAIEVERLQGLVIMSSSGLDPRVFGEMQASRLGLVGDWQALMSVVKSDVPGSEITQGRSLTYWRDFFSWDYSSRLIQYPAPLLRAWGGRDALIPPEAFAAFGELAKRRRFPFCDLWFSEADHALQSDTKDEKKVVWARLENWARSPSIGLCH